MKRSLSLLLLGALLVFVLVGFVAAAPQPANANINVITVANAEVVTASKNWSTYSWLSNSSGWGFKDAEIFYVIDQTDVNTLTLALQVSPDGSTWVAHTADSAVVTDNAADATGYKAASVDGRYFRIAATAANTNPVTVTIKAVLH